MSCETFACKVFALFAAAAIGSLCMAWLVTFLPAFRRYEKIDAERARLEQIVIDQQTELGRLQRRYDTLKEDFRTRGDNNARLNKELQGLQRRAQSCPQCRGKAM